MKKSDQFFSPISSSNTNNFKYGTFLKRKRLEAKKTLEIISEGVCAASYLSRIENNLVEVDDEYYVKLFEKLNIDFDELKEVKENEIFCELLKCYLLEHDEEAVKIISKALRTNYYVEIEIELMVLYDNINRGLYSEALKQILDLNGKVNTLIDNELNFYIFLTALYAFRTNQSLFAYRQIIFLCEQTFDNPIYKYAVYDLALDIFDFIGAKVQFLKYYDILNKDKYSTIYPKSALKHQAQKLLIESYLLKDEEDNILEEILDGASGKCKEEIIWQILKKEYRKGDFVKCLEISSKLDPNPKLIAFESLVTLRVNDTQYIKRLEERRNCFTIRNYDESFELMYLITIQIKKYHETKNAFELFKKLLKLQNEQTYCNFLFDEQIIIFMELAQSCGKYKEALKIIMNIMKDKLLFPYFL